jgi:hypothetical protein
VSAKYFPKGRNAYQVFLTDMPLYDGDRKGAAWWAWLVVPIAIILPPAAMYALIVAAARFTRWIYLSGVLSGFLTINLLMTAKNAYL